MDFFSTFYDNMHTAFMHGIFGLSLFDISIIILSFLIASIIRGFIAKFIVEKVKKIILRTGNKIDDKLFEALIPPFKLLPIVFVFLVVTLYFQIDSTLGIYLQKINKTLATIFIFWLFYQSLVPFSVLFQNLEKLLSKALVIWILKSLKYLVLFLGVVAVLDVWGIKIGPIIAGLGLFGVAVALGAQDLFKNLISGVMILFEKRFHIGDVVMVPGHTEGTVEHIGFRSTLIRKFDSTPISIPNYIFGEAPIINYTNRIFRRINWVVGLEYNSTIDQIKELTDFIKKYFDQSQDFTVNDDFKSYVRLDKFNDSSIDILIICFSSTNDWGKFLEIKERLAYEIKKKVESLGLSFAFPSQSIYIEKDKD